MKKIVLILAPLCFFSLGVVEAKENFFDLKKGVLETPCVYVGDEFGYFDATFDQRGASANFKLTSALPSEEGSCPPVLNEGDSCEIIVDITADTEVTFLADDTVCTDCNVTQSIPGTIDGEGSCVAIEIP